MRTIGAILPRRIRRGLPAAALLAAAAAGALPSAPRASAQACGSVRAYGHWSAVRMPYYPEPTDDGLNQVGYLENGSSTTRPWAPSTIGIVDANDRKRIFGTNGRAIEGSSDGGCTWKLLFSIDPGNGPSGDYQTQMLGLDYRVIALAAATARNSSRTYLYAAIVDHNDAQATPLYVAASADSGRTWHVTDPTVEVGADIDGTRLTATVDLHVTGLTVAPSAPGHAYLTAEPAGRSTGAVAQQLLLATTDGGSHWRVDLDAKFGLPTNATVTGIAVDPADPHSVWLDACPTSGGGPVRVVHSANDGRSWRTSLALSDPKAQQVAGGTAVSVLHPRARPATVLAWCRGSVAHLSVNGGRTFTSVPPPRSPYFCPSQSMNSYNANPSFVGIALRPARHDAVAASTVFPCSGGYDTATQFWRLTLRPRHWRALPTGGLFGRNASLTVSELTVGGGDTAAGLAQPFYGFGGTPPSELVQYSGG